MIGAVLNRLVGMGLNRYPNKIPPKFRRFWPFCHFPIANHYVSYFYLITILDPNTKLKPRYSAIWLISCHVYLFYQKIGKWEVVKG